MMQSLRTQSLLTPLLALAAITLARLIAAAAVPVSPDEAYYWVWSRALAPVTPFPVRFPTIHQ
mgnify:CR=1 FL=1